MTAAAIAAVAGCSGPQSALDTAGTAAADIAGLGWTMFAGAGVILAIVLVLLAYAIAARPQRRRWMSGRALVVGAGLVFPIVALSALLVWTLVIVGAGPSAPPASFRIVVIGEQWWWRVSYVGADGSPLFDTANEIRLPVGRRVAIELHSADVIHSFWVPSLAGKLDMIPGHGNTLSLAADRPGTFRGQCAEYCGGPHALMALMVVAEPPERVEAWMQSQARPAAPPAAPVLARGRALFLASGCGACHAVKGTDAAGTIGPDLTHVGGRLTIGAGLLPTHAGTLAAWTVDAGHLKPGVRMPPFEVFTGEELRALAAWLESLE